MFKSLNKKYLILLVVVSLFCAVLAWVMIGWPVEKFTIIVLPDSQNYSKKYPHIFTNQTEWIISQIENRNIVFVSHEGDIVDTWDSVVEWENAKASMSLLDNKVPYGVLPGNHDMSNQRKTTYYNQYFPFSQNSKGSYPVGQNDNNYRLFSINKDDYIIINLEFCPTPEVIDWTNGILEDYSDRRAIITTHGYLDNEGERNVHTSSDKKGGCTASSNNTQYIWDELIYPNQNVFLILSGHVHDEARRTDNNIAGEPVYQLLANYQDRDNGGNGWLRILEFVPIEDKIYVKTYSPYLNHYETDENSDFILDYDMTDSKQM